MRSKTKLLLHLFRKRSLLIAVIVVPLLALINSLLINIIYMRIFRFLIISERSIDNVFTHYRHILISVVFFEFIILAGIILAISYIGKKVILDLRKRFNIANEKLTTSEEKYQAILEQIGDGIVIFRDDKILWANDRFCDFVGYPKDEIVDADLYRFIAPRFREIVKTRYRLRKEGKPVPRSYEIEGIHHDRRRLPVEVVPTFVQYEGELANQTIVRDLTEANMIKSQLLHSSRMVAIGEVSSNLAHQLNNPLVGVVDMAKLLLNKENLPKEYRTHIQTILEAGQDSAGIIRNLLKYSCKDKIAIRQANIPEIVEEVLTISERNLSYENVTVIKNFKLPLPLVECNEVQMGQVFLNIIQNARQAMTGGGTLTISARHLKNEEQVEIRFKDTGPGIGPENYERIFEPCFSTKQNGTGLGLSIGSKIINNHDGILEVESREGAGATFVIKLPIKSTKTETDGTASQNFNC
jgi:PAS domain S-box-containing protein